MLRCRCRPCIFIQACSFLSLPYKRNTHGSTTDSLSTCHSQLLCYADRYHHQHGSREWLIRARPAHRHRACQPAGGDVLCLCRRHYHRRRAAGTRRTLHTGVWQGDDGSLLHRHGRHGFDFAGDDTRRCCRCGYDGTGFRLDAFSDCPGRREVSMPTTKTKQPYLQTCVCLMGALTR